MNRTYDARTMSDTHRDLIAGWLRRHDIDPTHVKTVEYRTITKTASVIAYETNSNGHRFTRPSGEPAMREFTFKTTEPPPELP